MAHDVVVALIVGLPPVTFIALALGEKFLPTVSSRGRDSGADVFANLSGFAMQGAMVPGLAYLVSAIVLPQLAPGAEGILGLGFIGAFVLCFVGVDLLYYAQHVAFHHIGVLWRLHRCHHASPRVSVWTTARNSLVTHFALVYLLVNPWLAYLSGSVDGYLLAASLTASLDLWRHTRLAPGRYWSALEWLLITPRLHHCHHDADDQGPTSAPIYRCGTDVRNVARRRHVSSGVCRARRPDTGHSYCTIARREPRNAASRLNGRIYAPHARSTANAFSAEDSAMPPARVNLRRNVEQDPPR